MKAISTQLLRVISTCLMVSLFVFGTARAQSADADRGFHRMPLVATTTGGESLNLYEGSHALLIGASRYKQWGALSSIPGELDELDLALEEQGFSVQRLQDPSFGELKSGIESFISQYGYEKNNRLLIFFAGHGHSEGDRGFLIPVDAPTPENRTEFRRKALPMSQVMAWARDIESKHVLFIFDSCFSGTVFKSRNLPRAQDRYIRKATERPVRQFLTAGSAGEVVPAKSTFTPALVEAIRGAGDTNNDGYVTGNELGVHLSQLVPRFTDQTPQFGSIRDYELGQGDFVFFSGPKHSADTQNTVDTQSNSTPVPLGDVAELPVGILDNALWEAATQDNTESSYQRYLERFENGVFSGIAKDRLQRLRQAREQREAQLAAEQARVLEEQRQQAQAQEDTDRQAALAEQQRLETIDRERNQAARLAQAKAAETTLSLSRNWRRGVQVGLNAAGISVGTPDGLWGARTREGIRQWQAEKGLPETGYLNESDYRQLVAELSVREVAPPKPERQAFEPEMVRIEGGRFEMGTRSGGGASDELPVRTVRVGAFEMGKYEVTFNQYDIYARSAGVALPDDEGWGRGSRPVINVSWKDAQNYINWLNAKTAGGYRLPSEAEWEYAARAGTTGSWSFTGDESALCNYGNGRGNSCQDGFENTAPVGSFKSNKNGLFDVHGNVREWTQDCWHENYRGAPTNGSAWINNGDCGRRVLRGGSWSIVPNLLRSANRSRGFTSSRGIITGFRLSRTLTP